MRYLRWRPPIASEVHGRLAGERKGDNKSPKRRVTTAVVSEALLTRAKRPIWPP